MHSLRFCPDEFQSQSDEMGAELSMDTFDLRDTQKIGFVREFDMNLRDRPWRLCRQCIAEPLCLRVLGIRSWGFSGFLKKIHQHGP